MSSFWSIQLETGPRHETTFLLAILSIRLPKLPGPRTDNEAYSISEICWVQRSYCVRDLEICTLIGHTCTEGVDGSRRSSSPSNVADQLRCVPHCRITNANLNKTPIEDIGCCSTHFVPSASYRSRVLSNDTISGRRTDLISQTSFMRF